MIHILHKKAIKIDLKVDYFNLDLNPDPKPDLNLQAAK